MMTPKVLFPNYQVLSPSTPTTPSKTPSIVATSSSFINSKLKSPTSSTSPSTNGYLASTMSPPLRVHPPPLTQENGSMDITLTLSPITSLDIQVNTPSPSIPLPPLFGHPISWNLLEAHRATCLCCIHNCRLILSLKGRDEKKRLDHLKQDEEMLVIKIFSKRKKVFRERKKCEKIRAKREKKKKFVTHDLERYEFEKTFNNDKSLNEIQLEHEKEDGFVVVVVKVEIVNRFLEEVERSWNGGLSKTLMIKEKRMNKDAKDDLAKQGNDSLRM
uniref:Uncharacterized protein n=1 Tax=Tanacetum cinerariifolium TaxID=118510 RepID=A0A6L2JXQ2_TANCI|nr:hypothetical protein [Tanacetum cinerariifolium]